MGTVTKALSLLGLFNQSRTEIGLSDVARLSGMNKATVYRLLSGLRAGGFVEQVSSGRTYRLGSEVLRLAALREAAVPLLSVSGDVLKQLSDETGETSHMSLVRGTQLNALAYRYSAAHATRVMMEDAQVLSFHATSSGLAVLAFAEPEFIDQILSAPLRAFTNQTLTDPHAVQARLDEIRQTGIAVSVGGFEADVYSHAAPVFGADQRPTGALSVAAPQLRVTDDTRLNIRACVAAGARALTYRTGGFQPDSFPTDDAT